MSLDDVITGLLAHDKYRFEVWNKLWRRSLIDDIRFKEDQLCEEVYFDRKAFLKANCFACTDLELYHYLTERKGNTNSTFREKKIASLQEYIEFNNGLIQYGKNALGQIMLFNEVLAAMQLYYHAHQTRQSKDNMNKIRQYFNDGYHDLQSTRIRSYKDAIAIKLFKYSPRLYCTLRRLM